MTAAQSLQVSRMLGCVTGGFCERAGAAECEVAWLSLLGKEKAQGMRKYLYAYAEGKHCCGPDFRMDGVQQPAEQQQCISIHLRSPQHSQLQAYK